MSENEPILAELRSIKRLLIAFVAIKDLKREEKIRVLDNMGYQPKEIGEILGTTANTIRVTLHSIRKKEKKGKNAETGQNSTEGSK